MASTKLMPLYEQVAGRIEHEIESGRFAPGERIYSIREICEQFAVADVTAKSALRKLRQRGVIRTVNGAGAYVTQRDAQRDKTPTASPSVALIKVRGQPAPVFVTEIDLIQQELFGLNLPATYTVAMLERQEEIDKLLGQLRQTAAGCVIVFPSHVGEFEKSPYMNALRSTGLPLLVIESRSSKDPYITAGTERATRELTEYLYDEGHRRICLATAFGRKVEGFRATVERWKDPRVKTWIIGETGKTDTDAHHLARQILELKPRPTAVIAGNDHAAAVIISHFLTVGVRVPEDISVVTYGDHPAEGRLSPIPVTVMRHPYVEIAQEVARWAHEQLTTPGKTRRIRREITGTLIIRESSGPPTSTDG